jgi:hypothetical protein
MSVRTSTSAHRPRAVGACGGASIGRTTVAVPGVGVPTTSGDSTLGTGFKVVVCNQGALTQPTALGAPAYVTEPDAQTLSADLIAANGMASDVYVSSSQDTAQGPVRYQALFGDVSSATAGLHVDATGRLGAPTPRCVAD